MSQFIYVGTELELFAQAKNWKDYLRVLLRRYIKGDVLEVGAGIGSNTRLLCRSQYQKWLCLEPDTQLFQDLENSIRSNNIIDCFASNGKIDSLHEEQLFDAILYLDVLEHIKRDREEVIKASRHLKPDGNLIIVAPAHQWLFTPFDTAIGHYRRYNKQTLKAVLPDDIEIIKLNYLDCVGLLASLGNKLVLKQSQPTLKQIKVWDRFMVPISRKLDPIIGYSFGKSVLLVGRKKF
ncbi:MAG: class I SAM-dependent methyltransferase [Hydrococcus sp. C42_A2020_068]|uniref:class I SAM-dependent methyltransferase n=1 Tax=Pleurocapsa sp. PCC 7327 TaxID=118163 RepID=UPI00029F9542|nr:class I SAM-dependent methyltransferase [Pleurocapsa sp. PCC 7327]AFY78991.1 methyltransferase family protein [Pleurocapsa sp. PCC 7327]MBF2021398.1 class I SAM-dependent methyltransferase [Hydrococcus sp. C42_A2020_068]